MYYPRDRRRPGGDDWIGPKRPNMYSVLLKSWKDSGLGRAIIPVRAENKQEAERVALKSKYVEEVVGPTTRLEVLEM